VIVDANPAASAAFGDGLTGNTTDAALGIAHEGLSGQTEPSIESIDAADGIVRTYRLRVARVRPRGAEGGDGRQLVFQDLTEEYREQAAVRSYAAGLLAAHEEERRHIARELHDDPLQRLIHLARSMDNLVMQGGRGPDSAALQETRAELLAVIGRLRDVTRGLRPAGLDQLGLVAAVRGLLADVEDTHKVRLDFEVTGTPVRFAADAELGAFRIIQEAVSNVIRHASTGAALVGIDYQRDSVRIHVADDGLGFDARQETGDPGTHLGLAGMRERVNVLGGRLVVVSAPGTGTAIDAWLPMPHPSMSVAG
jgi:signal transduction histidine kinase